MFGLDGNVKDIIDSAGKEFKVLREKVERIEKTCEKILKEVKKNE